MEADLIHSGNRGERNAWGAGKVEQVVGVGRKLRSFGKKNALNCMGSARYLNAEKMGTEKET